MVTRMKTTGLGKGEEREVGSLDLLLELQVFDMHPELERSASSMQTRKAGLSKIVARSEATRVLLLLVSTAARDHRQYALHSGKIGASCSARGVRDTNTESWQMQIESWQMQIESFHGVGEGKGRGAAFVLQALAGADVA